MIEDIATDVSNKLNLSAPSSDFDDLVGMESHMTEMEPLLRLDSDESVRKIGILGPPGIGKTTIARSLFNQHAQDFQMSVFMGNIKRKHAIMACSDEYSVKLDLQKQFMSQLTNEMGIKVPHLGVAKDRLKNKKALVVFDDVDRSVPLEAMVSESWLGPGSRIIITTEDEKVLKKNEIGHIYRVNLPPDDEALQMFCMYAFGKNYPKNGFSDLAWEVISLVGRLPLGLRVMGSYFRGMSKQDWIKALPRIRTHLDQDGEIASILKFSYDALNDEDKRLFLHIACFFDGELVDIVESCLAKCFVDVTQGLCVLSEKSLISMEFGMINMAVLLVQLGRKIVREQSREPRKREFLNDASDIGEVLSDDKAGNSSIIGITLGLNEEIKWTSERAFERLSNLQFLRILGKGVNPRSIKYISRKLRVLIWPNFQMSCFPSSFNPEFLVQLDMTFSDLKKLWKGNKPLSNLKWMDLSGSKSLKELPDLSTATNLQELNLHSCSRLVKLPSSIGNAFNLQILNLNDCSRLVKLPSTIGNAFHLKRVNLKRCARLVELPSSIWNIVNLEKLNLIHCSSLVEHPFSIWNIVNFKKLDLYGCSSLVELPSIENAINLRKLDLSYCSSLVKLSSIGNAVNLRELDLSYCSSLTELPSSLRNLGRLWKLELKECSKLEVNLANINMESLGELDLSDCSLLKSYSTYIQELDPWIGRISGLRRLVLNGMKKLVSLPQLPDSVLELDVENCESLERLDCSFCNPDIRLNFRNCFKLNQEARDLVSLTGTSEYAVFPAEEVPMCFTYRSSGSSLTVKLDQLPVCKSTRFKVCFMCADKDKNNFLVWEDAFVCCGIKSRGNALTSSYKEVGRVLRGHLYTFEVEVETEEVPSSELVFEFELLNSYSKTWEIKECGILQLLDVPLLSFRGVDEDYEPSDNESSGDSDENYEPDREASGE